MILSQALTLDRSQQRLNFYEAPSFLCNIFNCWLVRIDKKQNLVEWVSSFLFIYFGKVAVY